MIEKVLNQLTHAGTSDDEQWLSVSDLMSGLMILFLFIAISLIIQSQSVAQAYQANQQAIYEALMKEFEKDLPKMGASIDPRTLTFTFNSPDILFETGSAKLKPNYKATLDNFFPRYMKVIDQYKTSIQEIRIEGHTSSEWVRGVSDDWAYFENMRLSQERTREVLQYVYGIDQVGKYRGWIKEHLAAVGLSSAKVIKNKDNVEDRQRSKRVTFRIITNADAQLEKITQDYQR